MSLLVVITTITTTFAWFSTQQTVIVDDVNISISGSGERVDDAGIVLSIDGENFKKDLDEMDVKRAVLIQNGYDALKMSDQEVNNVYKNVSFGDVTPVDYNDLTKGFTGLHKYKEEKSMASYIALDLYVSVSNDKYTDNIGLPLYFQTDKMAYADNVTKDMLIKMPKNPCFDEELPQRITVNPINASRLGTIVYEPVDRGDVTSQSDVYSSNIYTFSSETPSVENGVYNFGGINTEYNTMIEYYNSIMTNDKIQIPEDIKNREDKLIYGQEVFPSSLGCTTKKMVKIKILLWLEGWDADCFNVILNTTTTFNIKFTSEII